MGAHEEHRVRRTIFFCFAGPTASGKSTICRALAERESGLRLSISTTTRKPRATEVEGRDYYFVSDEEFQRRKLSGLFVEHATFSDHWYGTEAALNIERAIERGEDLLLDIDVQGVRALKEKFPGDVVTIFITPPNLKTLEERLRLRNQESKAEMAKRLQVAKQEFSTLISSGFSDYLLINDQLEETIARAIAILRAERLKIGRYTAEFLATIVGTAESR